MTTFADIEEGPPDITAAPASWLVIPAHNEQQRLARTLTGYLDRLGTADRIVVVVNGSIDATEEIAVAVAASDHRVRVLVDPARIGKGGAVLAGLRHVTEHGAPDDVVCFVDADGALSPGEVRRLCDKVGDDDMQVGSRWARGSVQVRPQPPLRRLASRVFNLCTRIMLRLDLRDTQCAGKAMKVRHLDRVVGRVSSPGFAFDLDLLMAVSEVGVTCREEPVEWEDQPGSTVRLRRHAPEMLRELVRLRRKYRKPPPSMESGQHLPPQERQRVLSTAQVVVGALVVVALIASGVLATVPTIVTVNVLVIGFFTAANVFKLVLIQRSLVSPSAIGISPDEPAMLADADLPLYTILLPVYREAAVLPQLVAGIARLDYPAERLDVKLLLEIDDEETRAAVATMTLPPYFDVLTIPDVGPTGKPRACNYGLLRAKGEYLVIFDAEDRPQPDQLRKVVAAFARTSPEVICMQAKLNYFNRGHNVLTRWFTAEYSLWFDALLPGLQTMDAAIPLGGTSNHFSVQHLRSLGGWNAYNVTEDADLGMRIYLSGWKTAILDSTTYEEATSRTGNWIRQRSRWVKGYLQTYLFFMRHPVRLARSMGWRSFTVFQLFFGAGTFCLLINPLYWGVTAAWFLTSWAGIMDVFPRPVLYVGTIGLFLGTAAFTLATVAGCFVRRNYSDVKWALLTPAYWMLMSVAAWKGFIQLCYKPHYWEKTVHGHCAFDDAELAAVIPTQRVIGLAPEPAARARVGAFES